MIECCIKLGEHPGDPAHEKYGTFKGQVSPYLKRAVFAGAEAEVVGARFLKGREREKES